VFLLLHLLEGEEGLETALVADCPERAVFGRALAVSVAAETDRASAQHLGARTSQHELHPAAAFADRGAVWPPLKAMTIPPSRATW
jgi:hypothetical protein